MSAGDIVYAADFGTPVTDDEATDETAFTSTSYIVGAAATCGTSFVAPTSGIVLVLWHVRFQCNTASTRAAVSVQVATGSTLGSGTVVSAATDEDCLETTQGAAGGADTRMGAGTHRVVTGLTPGSTYNVVTMHKTFSGNSTVFARRVTVLPIAVG